jgi:hypothetical protein
MSAIVVGTKVGKFIVLPNDLLGKSLISKREHEPHFGLLSERIVKQGDFCVDCGANIGYHTVKMAQLTGPAGKVFAIEPVRTIFQQLNGNIFLNNIYNVSTFNVALGNMNEIIEMEPIDLTLSELNAGATKVGRGGEKVMMVKLDDFKIPNLKFIKIDVQGCELELLKGAENTISNSRPIMFFETDEPYLKHCGTTTEILLNYILSIDYIIVRLGVYPWWDHLAIPREKKDTIPDIMKDFNNPYIIIDGNNIKVNFDGKVYTNTIHPYPLEVYGSFEITT